MILIIAEKPKVAGKIASAIGNAKFVKMGKAGYYAIGEEIAVAPAVGHVYTLAEKKKSFDYPVFDIEWVPSYKAVKGAYYTKDYISILEKLGKKADEVIIACDYDIEGSLIGYNVYRFAVGGGKKLKRMKFSTLTPYELKEAFENLSEMDYGNVYAGEARHILDWYYGINLSRALMRAIGSAGGKGITMSIGRVQGPTLEILVKREKEIRNFKPTPYWEIYAKIKNVYFIHEKEKFFDEKEADGARERTKKEGTVENVKKEEKKIPPNPPFDLTSLQLEASRVFGFSPSQTLQLAQSLYEASLISYPRTSSQKLPAKLGLQKIIERLKEQEEYREDAEKLLANKWLKPREGAKEDPAHPAIHPTGMKGKVGGNEKKLYDLIVRRFLSCFAPFAVREVVSVRVDAGEKYKAEGVKTRERGWIEFYPYAKIKDEELPDFKNGENVSIQKTEKKKKETKPPARFTPATLVKELERLHLGTKATRSVIVDTLYDRQYIKGKSIEVTEFGMVVEEVLGRHSPQILDVELTRRIEEEMEKIQEGKMEKERVVEEGKVVLTEILSRFKAEEKEIGKELLASWKVMDAEKNIVGKCPECGSDLRIIRMNGGKQFVGCSNYPNCKMIYPLPRNAYVLPTKKTCEECGAPVVKVKMGKKGMFEMCLNFECPSKKKIKEKKEKVK
ncbi:MAG: DNA topoisomerase I [Candidatus Anstonellales archaeon]